ncbi:hypothetical protein BN946_scf184455.g5 [Trametes cinnabarina]|uniref:Uncharacterized protein n=1 Tax=Pycnoporus cinnabarinus TaxID=5643 RepID=A0A060SRN8_PYCCI|nr:hypothetical protein BN946_scf184455.g5 [Trametes cinnabarina]
MAAQEPNNPYTYDSFEPMFSSPAFPTFPTSPNSSTMFSTNATFALSPSSSVSVPHSSQPVADIFQSPTITGHVSSAWLLDPDDFEGLPTQEQASTFDVLTATLEGLPDQDSDTLCDALMMYLHGMTPTSEGPRETPHVPEHEDNVVPIVDGGATSASCLCPTMSRMQPDSSSSAQTGCVPSPDSESTSQPSLYRSPVSSPPSSPGLQPGSLRGVALPPTMPPSKRAAETDPSGAPPAKYRRVEVHRDSDDDSDEDGSPGFIYNATKRMKSHSKRLPVVLKKIALY